MTSPALQHTPSHSFLSPPSSRHVAITALDTLFPFSTHQQLAGFLSKHSLPITFHQTLSQRCPPVLRLRLIYPLLSSNHHQSQIPRLVLPYRPFSPLHSPFLSDTPRYTHTYTLHFKYPSDPLTVSKPSSSFSPCLILFQTLLSLSPK